MPLAAQVAVTHRAPARSAPGGTVIGTVSAGAKVTSREVKGDAARIVIEGWVDASRVGGKRDSFPASVGGALQKAAIWNEVKDKLNQSGSGKKAAFNWAAF